MFNLDVFVESGLFCRPNVECPFDLVARVNAAKAARFQQYRPWQIQLCRQCVPGLSEPELAVCPRHILH